MFKQIENLRKEKENLTKEIFDLQEELKQLKEEKLIYIDKEPDNELQWKMVETRVKDSENIKFVGERMFEMIKELQQILEENKKLIEHLEEKNNQNDRLINGHIGIFMKMTIQFEILNNILNNYLKEEMVKKTILEDKKYDEKMES